jgi:hypothetical protein
VLLARPLKSRIGRLPENSCFGSVEKDSADANSASACSNLESRFVTKSAYRLNAPASSIDLATDPLGLHPVSDTNVVNVGGAQSGLSLRIKLHAASYFPLTPARD